jgi:hypothetical protein
MQAEIHIADGDALTRPPHVNIDEIVVKALAQSSGGRILRQET